MKRRCFRGAPLPEPPPPPPLPAGLLGAATAEGHGARDRRERRGREQVSPLVNSAGPCSLFKALNRGWYFSAPEFGAGGVLALA